MSTAGASARHVLCMSHTSPCMQLAHVSKSAACQLPCASVPRLDVAMTVFQRSVNNTRCLLSLLQASVSQDRPWVLTCCPQKWWGPPGGVWLES